MCWGQVGSQWKKLSTPQLPSPFLWLKIDTFPLLHLMIQYTSILWKLTAADVGGKTFLLHTNVTCSYLLAKPCVTQGIQTFTRTAIVQTHYNSRTGCFDVILNAAEDYCFLRATGFPIPWIQDVVSQPRSACTNKMFEQTSSPISASLLVVSYSEHPRSLLRFGYKV